MSQRTAQHHLSKQPHLHLDQTQSVTTHYRHCHQWGWLIGRMHGLSATGWIYGWEIWTNKKNTECYINWLYIPVRCSLVVVKHSGAHGSRSNMSSLTPPCPHCLQHRIYRLLLVGGVRVANGKFMPCHSTIVNYSADRHAPMCKW